ncbi:MAG: HAD-IIIC family phosphatase [Promethearchaeota archaeon]
MSEEKIYKRIVFDVDGTLCKTKAPNQSYSEVEPDITVINKLKEYKNNGFYIILYSSRQMRTYKNNIGKILVNTLPILLEWLQKYDIPYDEIHMGKPWCGYEGFYVDDKTIRPDEFLNMTLEEIYSLLNINKKKNE